MARWLEQLRVQIPEPPGEEPTKPTKGASVGFVGTQGGVFQKKQAAEEGSVNAGTLAQELPLPALLRGKPSLAPDVAQRPAGPAQALRQAIQQARDWQGLETTLGQVQALFEAGQLTQEEAEALAAIAAQEAQVLPELAEEERLGDLLCRQPLVRLGSRLLGEEILLAADGAQVPDGSGLVVYREAELRRVVGRPPEEVRAIHTVKKALEGEVIGDD